MEQKMKKVVGPTFTGPKWCIAQIYKTILFNVSNMYIVIDKNKIL